MKNAWALQDAKNRLSEIVVRAAAEGPQTITRRGKDAAVLLSIDEFRRLTARRGDLVAFFRRSPLSGVHLDIGRRDDLGREIDL